MINLDPSATFTAEAAIPVPGKAEPVKVAFEFRALPRKRIASLLILAGIVRAWFGKRWLERLRLCWRVKRVASVVDMLDEFVVGWDGIEPAYSRDVLKALLLEYPGAHMNIFAAFVNAWHEERIKN